MRRGLLLGFACLLGSLTLVAQDEKPDKTGAAVPSAFRGFVVSDDRYPPKVAPVKAPEDRDPRDRTDKLHCLVCEFGLSPVAIVLSRATPAEDGPAAKLAKQLDLVLQTREARGNSFNAAVVFLTLEGEYPTDIRRNDKGEFLREEAAKQVKDLATQLKTPRVVFALAAKASPELAGWGVADADETAVVLYNRLRVVKRWNFAAGGPSDDEVKAVAAAVKAESVK